MHAENSTWRRLLSTPPFTGTKRGLGVGPTKRGKGTKIIALADDHSLPLAVRIEMIAPYRGERREPTQDGRALRRYRRRSRVERLFAWLHHFRRQVIRWECHVENFLGTGPPRVHANLVEVFMSDYS